MGNNSSGGGFLVCGNFFYCIFSLLRKMEDSGIGGGGGRISRNGVVMKKEGLGFFNEGLRLENFFVFKVF